MDSILSNIEKTIQERDQKGDVEYTDSMRIWTIADLHLSFGVKNKSMDYFGPAWADHAQKMADSWRAAIAPEDLVLIPGDISWAMKLEEAVPDLQWIHELPGRFQFRFLDKVTIYIGRWFDV